MATQANKSVKVIDVGSKLTGDQKAAIFLLSIPQEQVGKIFEKLEPSEVVRLSAQMANSGIVKAPVVENLYKEFTEMIGASGSLMGTLESTEKLLSALFDKERVKNIMEEVRGPAGRDMWEKLGNVSESVLASYLRNEYPQTAAVILSRIKPDHAARVFALIPRAQALDIMMRMLKMDVVQKDILEGVETNLRTEFMTNLAKSYQKDPYEHVAEVFNSFDRSTEGQFMEALDSMNHDSAEKIKSLMFTFDDIVRLDTNGIQMIIRTADKTKLALALKGASEEIKELFFKNMSERAAKLMKDDMASMGMVRVKDVDESQLIIVSLTKELADKGEINIQQGGAEDEQLVG